ncbi:MAG: 1-(5-phosphoribosyl)-5-[(5-phosphoribosylamino)methylideneamino]imidazole-4-carboxamide isomerase [Bacteroidota bacterium]
MRIIPAIDIIEGKCVRLEQGDYERKKVYNENPLEVAKSFESHGIQHLHVVDLDGAKAGKVLNWKVLEQLTTKTGLTIDFGGGIKRDEDVKIAFESGASQINVGSLAAKNRELFLSWLEKEGADKVILSADAKNRFIAVQGWLDATELDVLEYIGAYAEEGVKFVTCTDISKDGMLSGPSYELYKEILEQSPDIFLNASGGVSKFEDIEQLQEMRIPGVIVGKAIYEGKISLSTISQFYQ